MIRQGRVRPSDAPGLGLEITKEWLENYADRWESKWQLACIQRIELSPQYGYVYITPNQAIILPVRCFTSPDHFATFIANLEGQWGKRAEQKQG